MGSRYAQRRAPRAAATSWSHGHAAQGGQDSPVMTAAPNGAGKTAAATPAAVAVRRKPKPAPPHAPFDPRVSKKIARGRHSIDARLDLHGLRQQDAYVVLRRFLARCQANGLRHVLVITGKGGEPDDRADPRFLAVAGTGHSSQARAAMACGTELSPACRELHRVRNETWRQRSALRDHPQGATPLAARVIGKITYMFTYAHFTKQNQF